MLAVHVLYIFFFVRLKYLRKIDPVCQAIIIFEGVFHCNLLI